MKKALKTALTIFLVLCTVFCTTPYKAQATQSTRDKLTEAQKQKEAAQGKVDDAQDQVDDLTERKDAFKKELNGLNSDLETIVARITEIDNNITAKEEEIAKTQAALEEARNTETNQYESMKKRIQYMYEDSENLYLEIMFQAKTFSNFITLSNYVDDLASYDRKKFEEYQATRITIEELEAKLEDEKAELDVLKADAEDEKAELQVSINNTQSNISKYSDLLDDAEAELLAYEEELKKASENEAALKKQLEEEIRLSQLAAKSAWRDISEVSFDSNDRYLLAVLIYCEAGGEPYEGQVAVGAVVINRVLSSVYPNTVSGVIYQPYQFSPVSSGRFAYYLSIGKTTQSCYNAADAAMSGVTNVGNCLHFRTPIAGLTGTQIGNHIFY